MNGYVSQYRPAELWHQIIGEYVSVIKITPRFALMSFNSGRLTPETTDVMFSVVETSRIINRMMGKNEDAGA